MAEQIERFYTPPQVAEMLNTQPENVLLWIKRGLLRAVNIALPEAKKPRWQISPAALEEYLASRASVKPEPRHGRRRSREQVPQYV